VPALEVVAISNEGQRVVRVRSSRSGLTLTPTLTLTLTLTLNQLGAEAARMAFFVIATIE
jgi:hypothetical protein